MSTDAPTNSPSDGIVQPNHLFLANSEYTEYNISVITNIPGNFICDDHKCTVTINIVHFGVPTESDLGNPDGVLTLIYSYTSKETPLSYEDYRIAGYEYSTFFDILNSNKSSTPPQIIFGDSPMDGVMGVVLNINGKQVDFGPMAVSNQDSGTGITIPIPGITDYDSIVRQKGEDGQAKLMFSTYLSETEDVATFNYLTHIDKNFLTVPVITFNDKAKISPIKPTVTVADGLLIGSGRGGGNSFLFWVLNGVSPPPTTVSPSLLQYLVISDMGGMAIYKAPESTQPPTTTSSSSIPKWGIILIIINIIVICSLIWYFAFRK